MSTPERVQGSWQHVIANPDLYLPQDVDDAYEMQAMRMDDLFFEQQADGLSNQQAATVGIYTASFFDGTDSTFHAADDEEARLSILSMDAAVEHNGPWKDLLNLRDSTGREVHDPLAGIRDIVGPDGRARLYELDHRSEVTELDNDQLRAIVADHQAAIDAFPGREALEVQRIVRDRADAWNQREWATVDATKLRQQLDALPRRDRVERRELAAQIAKHDSAAAGAQRAHDELDAREQQLRDSARHPDQWIDQHGQDAIQWAHAQRELQLRDEIALDVAVNDAILYPPPYLQQTLGERSGDAAVRRRWDELAGDLERRRLTQAIDVDRDGPVGPRRPGDRGREQLITRIHTSRLERGLPPGPPGLELEIETIDIEIGT